MNRDIVNTLIEACKSGELETEAVLYAALSELANIDDNTILEMAIENKFIEKEDFLLPEVPEPDETDRIQKEIDEDVELTAQQKIIEKVLARYGDV
jgi:hypothetical protein